MSGLKKYHFPRGIRFWWLFRNKCDGLCCLVEGWVPVDASSGCPVFDWAVETRRWGAGWWPWWCLGGRHAPLDWNSYCVHELAHNTLLLTLYCFYLFFYKQLLLQHKGCHVLLCMSQNTGQINPAGLQSLKYMHYIHVIMTIKWFWLELTWLGIQQILKWLYHVTVTYSLLLSVHL